MIARFSAIDKAAGRLFFLAGSVTYVRWGRTTCPSGAELVYEGRAGGAGHGTSGGGSSYQCLPKQPIYDGYYTGSGQTYSYMYNAEYEVYKFNPFAPHVQRDDDVPCVVCLVRGKTALLMIPARNVCPSGWRREYYGYLMASSNGGHSNDYACVDRNAEAVPGTRNAETGAQMYFVDARRLK
ncbi:short-chain collagen C4-like [Oscarella lobularis]|uniref:short-chain collagen C4-like n=1 Tax=Oscarella lobularis TaxID=121494 RepID=UPI0033137076